MSNEIQVRRPNVGYEPVPANLAAAGEGSGAPALSYDGEPEPIESVFAKLHRLLRGRYKWCVAVALLLMAGGIVGGIMLGERVYESKGEVQVKPVLPTYVAPIPETGVMPFYENFVASQMVHITSQRVVGLALQSPEWKALGRPLTDETMKDFLLRLSVKPIARSEVIQVSFKDPDPLVATVAVKEVLKAYDKIHVETEGDAQKAKEYALDLRRGELAQRLEGVHGRILDETGNMGIEGFRSLHAMKLHRLSLLTQTKNDIEVMLLAAGKGTDSASGSADGTGTAGTGSAETRGVGGATTDANGSYPADAAGGAVVAAGAMPDQGAAAATAAELSVEEIAFRDSAMRNLIQDRDNQKFLIDVTLRTLGANHPKKKDALALLSVKEAAIEVYAKHYRATAAALAATVASTGAGVGTGAALNPTLNGATPVQLQARLKSMENMIEDAQKQVTASGQKLANAERLQREADQLVASMDQIKRRIEQLQTELTPAHGRIVVNLPSDRPSFDNDTRPKYAAMGGMLGLGLGVGFFLFLGLIDPRVRSLDEARLNVKHMALLGVLPSLPEDLADPEQSALAAHCVHQIRTLLQISTGGAGAGVFSVTSPASGSGKTSLTLALGVSFAAANSRTLMIDCDIIGGGLTSRVDAIVRRKVGQVLRQQGLITQQQLETALRAASGSRKLIGQVLVELGFVSQDDLDEALAAQRMTAIGMMDVIVGADSLQDCIADTGIQGLSILPLGSAAPMDVSKLSPSAIRRLIEQVRHAYDVVLVDTGPVPGSLEASVAAASADGVILVLARGEHRALAERSIQHLRDIGARLAGMVFNRAEGRDMEFSTTANRTSSYERRSGMVPPVGVGGPVDVEAEPVAGTRRQSQSFGPVATAVTGPRNASGQSGNVEER